MTINEMSIDLETYSDIDIGRAGVYKYAESDHFEILLFAVSINDGPVKLYDLASGDVLPEEIIDAIVSEDVIKWAFNASFERICLSNYIRKHYPAKFKGYGQSGDTTTNYLKPASWRCSMIWSAYFSTAFAISGRFVLSRSPPQPNRQISLPLVFSLTPGSIFSSASGE